MDAVKYLKERKRRCKRGHCRNCGFAACSETESVEGEVSYGCDRIGLEEHDPEEAVRIVEEWSKAHPIQTNGQKFSEVFGYGPHDFSSASPETTVVALLRKWWDTPYEAPKEAQP